MLTLIEKGLSRQQAYAIVQRNSLTAWKEKKSFLKLLESDPEVTGKLSRGELHRLFDYNFFVKHIDDSFRRLGWVDEG
jgi:adenylosuccinate lyase